MLSDLFLRLRALCKRSTIEREVDAEIRFHVDSQVESYVKGGIVHDEAVRRAHLEFGGVDQVKEEYRDALGVRLIDDLWRDMRYAVRTLGRSPLLAATSKASIGSARLTPSLRMAPPAPPTASTT